MCRHREFKGPEANVIERLIVDTESFIGVFYKLVNQKGSIVRLPILHQYIDHYIL